MKKTKKIISLFLTVQLLFACTLIPSAIATDIVIESSSIGSESPEELSPRAVTYCKLDLASNTFTELEVWETPEDVVYGGGTIYTASYASAQSLANSIGDCVQHAPHRPTLQNKYQYPHFSHISGGHICYGSPNVYS